MTTSTKILFQQQMVNEAARAVGHVLQMKVGGKGIPAGKDRTQLWDEVVNKLRNQMVRHSISHINTYF